VQGRAANQKSTFNQLLNKYTKAVQKYWSLKKRPRSPPRQDRAVSPRRESSRRRGDVVTLYPPQMCATMPWVPPASSATNPAWEHEGIWMQCFLMPYPPHYLGESSRVPVHDRLGPRQSGPVRQAAPVRPVTSDRSDRSPLTGQTGLTRGRARFLLQDSSIASRKRKRSRSLLLIQRSLKPMLFKSVKSRCP